MMEKSGKKGDKRGNVGKKGEKEGKIWRRRGRWKSVKSK